MFRFLLKAIACSALIATDVLAEDFVPQFLVTHCTDCHGGTDPEANLPLDVVSTDFTIATTADTWQRVLEQITLGQMPPVSSEQPDADEAARLKAWIRSKLHSVNQTAMIDHKLRSPEFGNHVNHERLFDGSISGPASSPPRLWRLNPHVYDRLVDRIGEGLGRETAIHQPFALDEGKGVIADYAAQNVADSATLQLLLMNCQTLTDFQTTGVSVRDHEGRSRLINRTPPAFEAIIQQDSAPSIEQLQAAIEYQYRLLLERDPTASEAERLIKLCQRAIKMGGNARGLKTMLQAILLQPEAVYRMELGLGPLDQHNRRRLSPTELAFALARAITDKGPSEINVTWPLNSAEGTRKSLLELANQGSLQEPAQIRSVVRQILDDNNMSTANYRMFTEDHKIGNTRVLRFFREFFGYHHAPKVFKDAKRIGHGERYLTDRMVDDADQLVMHLFDRDKDVLRRLLTTNEYFVAYLGSLEHIKADMHYIKTNVNDAGFEFNSAYVKRLEDSGRHPIPIEGPDSRMYVGFYNIDHENWDYPTEQPFRLPKQERAGILTHPAWLIAWSGNFDNDPIRRGKWIRTHLLADTIPDVPLDVNAVVPEDPHKSLRDRLTVTRAEYCWQCHAKMDPLGLPFERYDDFGRYRDREIIGQLLSIFPERHEDAKTLAIDTSGAIDDSGDAKLDGSVADVHELAARLADSDRVRQSFVRHAFRFWMGRNETLADSPTLMAADKAYLENGGSMKAMIASLLSSDSFLYRSSRSEAR